VLYVKVCLSCNWFPFIVPSVILQQSTVNKPVSKQAPDPLIARDLHRKPLYILPLTVSMTVISVTLCVTKISFYIKLFILFMSFLLFIFLLLILICSLLIDQISVSSL